jgi:hypothetical protein
MAPIENCAMDRFRDRFAGRAVVLSGGTWNLSRGSREQYGAWRIILALIPLESLTDPT